MPADAPLASAQHMSLKAEQRSNKADKRLVLAQAPALSVKP
jgi:hypothetical protein